MAKAQLISKKRELEQKRERERCFMESKVGGSKEGKLLIPERKMAGEKIGEGTSEGSRPGYRSGQADASPLLEDVSPTADAQ